jgi:hypothetical protein
MRKIRVATLLLLGVTAGLIALQWPEIKRYMKMREM